MIAAGLGLRAAASGPVAKYGGVALWSVAAYIAIAFVLPARPVATIALAALAVSYAVEALQLTPLPAWLSSQSVLLRLIFGTTFHVPDLPAYTAGVALAATADAVSRKRSDRLP